VARQYCGALGKVENCQSGVFVGYTSQRGYGLLTGRLYLPKIWFSKEYEQRRKDNWVPQDLVFQTKIEIAQALIQEVTQTQLFPSRWIGFDSTFGSDLHFLESLPKEYTYFAAVRSNTRVFLKKPSVEVPAYSGRGPRPKKRRLLLDQLGPQTVADIARRPHLRWKMDHYEHRSWPAWHRHMIYVFLALHFLTRLRIGLKKSPLLTLPQARLLIATIFELRTLRGKIGQECSMSREGPLLCSGNRRVEGEGIAAMLARLHGFCFYLWQISGFVKKHIV
jgi:hypothetical protein